MTSDSDSPFTPDGSDADLPPPPFPPPPAAPQGGPADLESSLVAHAADRPRGGPADLTPSLVAPDDLEPSAGIIALADGADRRKLRRTLHKRWANADSRNILSRNITSAIKTVLERSAPDRNIATRLRETTTPYRRTGTLAQPHDVPGGDRER